MFLFWPKAQPLLGACFKPRMLYDSSPKTYLDACLREGHLLRWPEKAMPLPVYVAPFRWYEARKQQEAPRYTHMVMEALDAWSQASGGLIRFRLVPQLKDSVIDLRWRRVDRRTLGHCTYHWNPQGELYTASIEIGISDGVVHSRYDNPNEVRHTVYHELGHALGLLGHSPHAGDIMYVPHQYGVAAPSQRDFQTLWALYQLPMGFDYLQEGVKLGLEGRFTIDEVMAIHAGWTPRPNPTSRGKALSQGSRVATKNLVSGQSIRAEDAIAPEQRPEDAKVLERQNDLLMQRGLFFLQTAHLIQPPPDTTPPTPLR
jgi:hypothetical protein